MSKIFILRHAETWRKEMMFSPPLGLQEENERILLSREGEQRSFDCAKKFPSVDFVVSSPYVRAMMTARYFVEQNQCPFRIDQRIGERKAGRDWASADWVRQFQDSEWKKPDGESAKEAAQRMAEAMKDCLGGEDSDILMISHGAVMKFLLLSMGAELHRICAETKEVEISWRGHSLLSGVLHHLDGFCFTYQGSDLKEIRRISMNKDR